MRKDISHYMIVEVELCLKWFKKRLESPKMRGFSGKDHFIVVAGELYVIQETTRIAKNEGFLW